MLTVNLDTELRRYRGRDDGFSAAGDSRQPRTLAEAVEMAVEQVDAGLLRPLAGPASSLVFQASTILGLLAYSYARQVYSSATIAAQLGRELRPFRFSETDVPDAQALQRFRAANREPLAFCLRSALLFLAEEKIQQGFVTHVKRAHINREAGRRIVMAMFTDSLEAPEECRAPSLADRRMGVAVGGDRTR